MRIKITLLLLLITKLVISNDITDYLNAYKNSGKADYKQERSIIINHSFDTLFNELAPFYNDSLTLVRQKAYYLLYKKGIESDIEIQQKAVLKLLQGCFDKNGGIVGLLISFILEFPKESFGEDAKDRINNLLQGKKVFHFKKLAMLAGQVNTGQEYLQKKFLIQDTNIETKWIIALALSRQGSAKHTNYCMDRINNMPVNSDVVAYIIPDLIYTRQKQTIDYCINIIYSDEKNCYSPNPDKPEFILCAYRIMELLAPVIEDFPYQVDATGSLISNDYEEALIVTRNWLTKNPNYQIRQ